MNINRRKFSGMFLGLPFIPLAKNSVQPEQNKLDIPLIEQWNDDDRIIKEIKNNLNRPFSLYICGSNVKISEYKGEVGYVSCVKFQCVAYINNSDLENDNLNEAFDSISLSVFPFIHYAQNFVTDFDIWEDRFLVQCKYEILDNKLDRITFGTSKNLIQFSLRLWSNIKFL